MSIADIASVVVIGGAVFALIAWFYKRGGQERAYTDALDRNTTANNEVAAELKDFKSLVLEMFHGLDKRVALLEKDTVK